MSTTDLFTDRPRTARERSRVVVIGGAMSRTGFDGDIETWEKLSCARTEEVPDELRERATRLVVEARRDPAAAVGAIRRIADQLGVHPEALRSWVKQAETDAGARSGTTRSDAERIAALERENRELRRTNRILKSAASFFAAELDRPSR